MKEDLFLRHVEDTRGCEEARLDAALSKGIKRAKNDRLDFGKFFALAAACVFTIAFSLIINMELLKPAAASFRLERNNMMPGASEALNGYVKDIAVVLKKYLGGI